MARSVPSDVREETIGPALAELPAPSTPPLEHDPAKPRGRTATGLPEPPCKFGGIATWPDMAHYLKSFSEADWAHLELYIYDRWPSCPNKKPLYMEKLSRAIPEDYVLKLFGCGDYEMMLNDTAIKGDRRTVCRAWIKDRDWDNPPKRNLETVDFQDKHNKSYVDYLVRAGKITPQGDIVSPQAQNSQETSSLAQALKDIALQAMRQNQERKPDQSAEAAVFPRVIEMLSKASDKSVEIALGQVRQNDPDQFVKLLTAVKDLTAPAGNSGGGEMMQVLLRMQEAADRRAEAAEKRAADAQSRSDQMFMKMMEGKSAGGGVQETMGLMTTMMEFANKMKGGEDGGGGLSGWKGVLASTAEYIPAALGHVEGIVKSVVGAPRRVVPLQANAAPGAQPQAPAIQQGQAIEVTAEEEPAEMTPQQKIMAKYARFVPMLTQHIGMSLASDDHGYEFAERFINMLGRGTYDEIASLGAEGVTALLRSHEDSYATISTSPRLPGFLAEFLRFPEGVPAELEGDEAEPEPAPAPKAKKGRK